MLGSNGGWEGGGGGLVGDWGGEASWARLSSHPVRVRLLNKLNIIKMSQSMSVCPQSV